MSSWNRVSEPQRVVVTVGAALLVDFDRPEEAALKQADWPGIGLLALFLGPLEYVLEKGSRWNWFDGADTQTGGAIIMFCDLAHFSCGPRCP